MSSRKSAPPKVIIETVSRLATLITSWIRKEDDMIRFYVGNLIKIVYNISVDEVYTNPGVTSITVLSPTGTTTVYTLADPELTQLDVGKFEFELDLTAAGEWKVALQGTAPAQGVKQGFVYAKDSVAA